MRRTTILAFALLLTSSALLADDLLQRGLDEFRAAQYAQAVVDLRAAADAPANWDGYVQSGHCAELPRIETALVYLALTYEKLGRIPDARETIRRLHLAEQVESTYQTLPLEADAVEFEKIARTLLPELPLPPNQALTQLRSGKRRRADMA